MGSLLNAHRWASAKPVRNFAGVAVHLVEPAAKARYQAVKKLTGVLWFFIAVAHEREASQNWNSAESRTLITAELPAYTLAG
jgi:lysozyme family protein